MKPFQKIISVVILLSCLPGFSGGSSAEENSVFRSGPQRAVLFELYTSEGCSSCPPADEWFSGLKRTSGLWKYFVPVAFHVDYWDRLGWKDRWADSRYTKRQRDYAASWSSESVYTPMIVHQGADFKDWYKTPKLVLQPGKAAGVLTIKKISGNEFDISFVPSAPEPKKKYRLFAAYLGFEIRSEVLSGENRGEVLKHDFSALDFVEKDLTGGNLSVRIVFDPKNLETAKRYGIAAWITDRDGSEPLQATGGFLT